MADPVHAEGNKIDEAGAEGMTDSENALKGQKSSRGKLCRVDSLHLEAGRVPHGQYHGAKVSLVPNQQAEDTMLSNYKLETPSSQLKRAAWTKEKLETSKKAQVMLFFITILATSMVIGDGVLTPCISVLSAVSGIKEAASSLTEGILNNPRKFRRLQHPLRSLY